MANGLEELARRAAGGDLAAFRALVEAANGRLYSLACHVLGDSREAEDATQEAWLRAYQALGRFTSHADGACLAWLRTIVLNVCRDWLRRRRVHRVLPTDNLDTASEHSAVGREPFRPPDELAIDRAAVRTAVAALPLPYREVVALRYGQDLGYAEIAAILATNERTVATRLRRSLERLRTLLSEEDGHASEQPASE